jgi:hypothetical protein
MVNLSKILKNTEKLQYDMRIAEIVTVKQNLTHITHNQDSLAPQLVQVYLQL